MQSIDPVTTKTSLEFERLLAFLDLTPGPAIAFVTAPRPQDPFLWGNSLAAALSSEGKRLERWDPLSISDVRRLTERILTEAPPLNAAALWLSILPAQGTEGRRVWTDALFRGFSALNQQRNALQQRWRVPIFIVGEPALLQIVGESAPDLWSVRGGVFRLPESAPAPPAATRENSLSILHLSDLHFRGHSSPSDQPGTFSANFEASLEAALSDLQFLRDAEGLQPDLLVCTGDLTLRASPKEFSDATGFLRALAERLGFKPERVVIVPGNHDVNWKDCQRAFEDAQEGGEPVAFPWYAKWKKYERAFADFYADVPDATFQPAQPWSLFRIPELQVVIAGLNSTMIEGHLSSRNDPDAPHQMDHAGWCGKRQLYWFADQLAGDDLRGWLKIGAIHHNLESNGSVSSESLRDTQDFIQILGSQLDFVLHGHSHSALSGGNLDGLLPRFGTGGAWLSTHIRPRDALDQYQILRLHPKGIQVRARRYEPDKAAWTDDSRLRQNGTTGYRTVPLVWRDVRRFPLPELPPLEDDPKTSFRSQPESALVTSTRFGRSDDFLSRVAECCALRVPGARIEEKRFSNRGISFLHVVDPRGGANERFPVGALPAGLTVESFEAFVNEVVLQYRAVVPGTSADLVYDGQRVESAELHLRGARAGVRLFNFVEYQRLIDFGAYLSRQNNLLEADVVYPPRLYVPQVMEFEIGGERGGTSDACDRVLEWLREPDPRFILVLGDFGTGKTFLIHEVARRLGQQRDAPVPLLIELRNLEKASRLDILLAQHFARQGFDRLDLPALHYMMRQGRVILLFDGFDELALRVGYDKASDHLGTLIEAAEGDARVVVTSRTSHFENDQQVRLALGRHVERLRGLRYCRLRSFDQDQVRAFLGKRFDSPIEAGLWFHLLVDVKDLLGLGENPRMLTFICQLTRPQLEGARDRTGTISAAQLYHVLLVDHWFGNEFKRRYPSGVPILLKPDEWLVPVTDLALKLWTRVDRWLSLDELRQTAISALARFGPDKVAYAEEATHVLGSGTLFIRDDEGHFTFVHQSVLEWLVARRIAKDLEKEQTSVLLGAAEMSNLMADFLLDMALRPAVLWREKVLLSAEAGSPTSKSNALTLLIRHTERLRESEKQGGEFARRAAEEERDRWLFTHQSSDEADFREANLRGRGFTGVMLREANLRGKGFTGVMLRGANLSGADLREALLIDCDLSGANLDGANLMGAVCDGAKFVGSSLQRVVADGCSALKANFTRAQMSGGSWRRARLMGANLTNKQKNDMDLWGASGENCETVELRWPAVTAEVRSVAWSPDGVLLASGHDDGTVRMYDASSGAELRVLKGHTGFVGALAWSADGGRLASGSTDNTVRIWQSDNGQELRVFQGHTGSVNALAWSADGGRLASGSTDNTVRIWQPDNGQELRVFQGHTGSVNALAWSADGRCLASGSWDNTVRIWQPDNGQELRALKGHTGSVNALAWSADGRRLASGSTDKTVRIWQSDNGQELRALKGHTDSVSALAWSADGGRLASGSWDNTVRIWQPDNGQELRVFQGHTGFVTALAWSADGGRLASGSTDNTVRIWQPDNGQELRVFQGHTGFVNALAWSADGGRLASGSTDNTVRIWQPDNGQELRVFQGHTGFVTALAWSADGGRLASGSTDKTVRIWQSDSGQELRVFQGHTGLVGALAWSADGRRLASGSWDNTVRIWQSDNGQELRALKGHTGSVSALAWSADGGRLASGSWDNTVRIWQPDNGQELRVFQGHTGFVNALAWSADGGRLASGSTDNTVRIWQSDNGQELRVFQGHTGSVNALAWSADGGRLASGSTDNTVRIWQPDNGEPIGIARHGFASVSEVSWHRGERWLVSGDRRGMLRIWDTSLLSEHKISSRRQPDDPAVEPIELQCVATFFATVDGWVVARPNGSFRYSGEAAKWPLFGSGLCRFTIAEVVALCPGWVLSENDPLIPDFS